MPLSNHLSLGSQADSLSHFLTTMDHRSNDDDRRTAAQEDKDDPGPERGQEKLPRQAMQQQNERQRKAPSGKHATKGHGVSNSPPHRKNQSYSQQLRTNTDANKHQQELQKHSLDENRINNGGHYKGNNPDSSDGENFYPYSTVTGIVVESVNDHHVDHQRIEADGGGGNDDPSHPLMEFTGNGGSVGIFKAPRQESGVRVWNYADAYKPGVGTRGMAKGSDEDAAAFHESVSTSPTTCLIVDQGSKLVWSGHKDGQIRSWKMELDFS
ncbi:hypothetical protein SASPL_113281 [Salvia splendens]|uniref:IP5PC-F beta-propeller domain-containing protein n=1 Tax=Salvia splendens TaxID=180675 RepID=A0A8X8Y1D8_SALSN|nr:hypothetical protein SASPL_113281 [Salvia splendens]